jgi:hypothetical protein
VQAGETLPDPFVPVDIEIVRVEELGDVVINFGVNENRPYDGFFGFTAVRDCR